MTSPFVCPLCALPVESFVDSHIYPQSFARKMEAPGGTLVHLSSDEAKVPKLVHRNGVYDKIVCRACEDSFKDADDYIARFLRDQSWNMDASGGLPFRRYTQADSALIRRFFVVTLYRAHLCARDEFVNVDLGEDADVIREEIQSRSWSPKLDVFVLAEIHPLSGVVVTPYPVQFDGVGAWRLTIPGFSALITFESKPLSPDLERARLRETGELMAIESSEIPMHLARVIGNALETHDGRIKGILTRYLE